MAAARDMAVRRGFAVRCRQPEARYSGCDIQEPEVGRSISELEEIFGSTIDPMSFVLVDTKMLSRIQ